MVTIVGNSQLPQIDGEKENEKNKKQSGDLTKFSGPPIYMESDNIILSPKLSRFLSANKTALIATKESILGIVEDPINTLKTMNESLVNTVPSLVKAGRRLPEVWERDKVDGLIKTTETVAEGVWLGGLLVAGGAVALAPLTKGASLVAVPYALKVSNYGFYTCMGTVGASVIKNEVDVFNSSDEDLEQETRELTKDFANATLSGVAIVTGNAIKGTIKSIPATAKYRGLSDVAANSVWLTWPVNKNKN